MRLITVFLKMMFVFPIQLAIAHVRKGRILSAMSIIFLGSLYGFSPYILLGIYTTWWIGAASLIMFMSIGTFVRLRSCNKFVESEDFDKAIEKGAEMADSVMKVFDEAGEVEKVDMGKLAKELTEIYHI